MSDTIKGAAADHEEIAKFAKIADTWWDIAGPFKALHAMNPIRMEFVKQHVLKHKKQSLAGLDILDAGCGGGIFSEELYKEKCQLIAIDATKESINIAKLHAQSQDLQIDYRFTLLDDLDASYDSFFDIVCSLEVVEHVPDIQGFIDAIAQRTKSGGLLFISTINRTVKSVLLAKYVAEYMLRLAEPGTHDWHKFVKPSELNNYLERAGFQLIAMQGLSLTPLLNRWTYSNNTDMNYIICARKL